MLNFWASKKHLQSHLRKARTGSIEFVCDRGTCGKTFADLSALVKHINLHDNNLEKCYFCPWGAVVGQTSHIATHLNQHLNQATFKCLFCVKRFFRKDHLDLHFEIYHEKIDGKYTCKHCGYKTHSRGCLSKHEMRFHK